jgi:hypothetical protein
MNRYTTPSRSNQKLFGITEDAVGYEGEEGGVNLAEDGAADEDEFAPAGAAWCGLGRGAGDVDVQSGGLDEEGGGWWGNSVPLPA